MLLTFFSLTFKILGMQTTTMMSTPSLLPPSMTMDMEMTMETKYQELTKEGQRTQREATKVGLMKVRMTLVTILLVAPPLLESCSPHRKPGK